ncbi:MAG: hypothetical protein KZQ57_01780 [gamma proteobacterium symbiont of Lucinoma myriamae]|nr:hypothetical protein [gamma proteobacterium symbiont of Lucinoma myriamae]
MKKLIFILPALFISSWLFSCSTPTSQKGETYNPETQEVDHQINTPHFQLRTDILPKKLSLSIVTNLTKDTLLGVYYIKKYTRRLLPNDYMAEADSTLYLHNLTDKTITFNLLNIIIENKRLPNSARNLSLSANESLSIPLGKVDIDLRLTTLNTRIEYIVSGADIAEEHKEKQFDMRRDIQPVEKEKEKYKPQEDTNKT